MNFSLLVFTTVIFSLPISAQEITGTWISVDDEDGQPSGHVEIIETDGIYSAKIIKMLQEEDGQVCIACNGDKKNKPIIGLEIIWNLKKKGDEFKGGKILDPKNGKVYKCKLKFQDEQTLAVRGFLGFSLLGRTQYWKRLIIE